MPLVYVASDNLLRGTRLRTVNLATGLEEYLDADATVTVTVVDAAGVEVVGDDWPVTLSYVAASQGTFLGVLRNELVWLEGEHWVAQITVDNGADQHREFTIPVEVVVG